MSHFSNFQNFDHLFRLTDKRDVYIMNFCYFYFIAYFIPLKYLPVLLDTLLIVWNLVSL